METGKIYKHCSEFEINMFLDKYQILQQQELKWVSKLEIFSKNEPCNIYFILKRPRITIDPEYFVSNDEYYELRFRIQLQDKYEAEIHRFYHPINNKVVKIASEYPNNYFVAISEKGDMTKIKVGAFIDSIQQERNYYRPLLDYQLLYIGKAFGKNGKRTAIDRLDSHPTLQRIYNDAIILYPDSEIWLMLANFGQKNMTSVIGGINIYPENEYNEFNRFLNFLNKDKMKISEEQKISFTEAGLINMFKPPFNEKYKDIFPSITHNSYTDCYKLDVNALSIDLNLSDYNRWIYSDNLPRGINNNLFRYCHTHRFSFVTDEDRYRLFYNECL